MARKRVGIALYVWTGVSLLALIGVLVVFAIVKVPGWVSALSIALCLLSLAAAATILIVKLVGARGQKAPAAFVGHGALNERIVQTTREAVRRYLTSVDRSHLKRSGALYERPWVVVFGESGSGKSVLLDRSGVTFPVTYPSERDGLRVGSDPVPRFLFGNEAVYIDTPGSWVGESSSQQWESLVAALASQRPQRPADAAVVTVDIQELAQATPERIKGLSERLRARIDTMIGAWGIEFPVYLALCKTDGIPGFNEFFGPRSAQWGQEALGAALGSDGPGGLPRLLFNEEFSLLCRTLTDHRVDRLVEERDDRRKREICRFVIQFEALQDRIGALISELFKPSSYQGKPLFSGFYFTGIGSSDQTVAPLAATAEPVSSNTIAAHPLNPHRGRAPEVMAPAAQGGAPLVRGLFSHTVLRKIIPGTGAGKVQSTGKKVRADRIRFGLAVGITFLVTTFLCGWAINSFVRAGSWYKTLTNDFDQIAQAPATPTGEWAALQLAGRHEQSLVRGVDRSARPGLGFYTPDKIGVPVTRTYATLLENRIGRPGAAWLEREISEKVRYYRPGNGDDYQQLYRLLKAYLSMTELVAQRRGDIDTVLMRPVLTGALTAEFVAANGRQRLPARLEEMFGQHIGRYLYLSRKGDLRLLQANQQLVRAARSCLAQVPGATGLYAMAIGKLAAREPVLTAAQLLNVQTLSWVSSSRPISSLYTQEGWDRVVKGALEDASRNPFGSDWVCGDQGGAQVMAGGERLSRELTAAYRADFETQWLGFLSGLSIGAIGEMERCRQMLDNITGAESEVGRLLDAVALKTSLTTENAAGRAVDKMAETAGKYSQSAAAALGGGGDGVRSFEILRRFVRSESATLGGMNRYRDQIVKVSAAAAQCQDAAQVFVVFNGGPGDPLLGAWNDTRTQLGQLGNDLSVALRGVLMGPLEQTGAVLSGVFEDGLTQVWKAEVFEPFSRRFAGRFPFAARSEEAAFDDVMGFFRPATGTLWGLHERALKAYVVKVNGVWQGRENPLVKPRWNPELFKAYAVAERISGSLFATNGEPRPLQIRVEPVSIAGNAAQVKLAVDGQEIVFKSGASQPGKIVWPAPASTEGAVLSVEVSGGYTQELRHGGKWGLLRLLNAADRVRAQSPSMFTAEWRLSVQNMYMVPVSMRFSISSGEHPLIDKTFEKFVCPDTPIRK